MKPWVWAAALAVVTTASVASARECDDQKKTPASAQSGVSNDTGIGGSGFTSYSSNAPVLERWPSGTPSSSSSSVTAGDQGYSPSPVAMNYKPRRSRSDNLLGGISVKAGGGLEGYAGQVSNWVNPGVLWGVSAAAQPGRVLGIELGYSGAANELREEMVGSEPVAGPDVVRNGLSAVATVGLPLEAIRLQPYALAGVGVNRFSVRGGQAAGFRSDTAADIPVGAGLKTRIGNFAADLRVDYNFGIGEQFAPLSSRSFIGTDSARRYQGLLQVGGAF
jgi:opacity protein-like surface antigen